MRSRLNRSLSSVKSLAHCFASLRIRHTSAYDFTCRHCGEALQPEKDLFKLLNAMCEGFSVEDGKKASASADESASIRDTLAELEREQSRHRGTP